MKKVNTITTTICLLLFSLSVLAEGPDPRYWYFVNGDTPAEWRWVIADPGNWWQPLEGHSGTSATGKLHLSTSPDQTLPGAVRMIWNKKGNWAGVGISGRTVDLSPFEHSGKLMIALKVEQRTSKPVEIKMTCGDDCSGKVNISTYIRKAKLDEWFALPIPLDCFAQEGVDLSKIDKPFEIGSESRLILHIAEISILPMEEGEVGCTGSGK